MKHSPSVLRGLAAATVALALLASQQELRAEVWPARSALEQAPQSILWVGNSFFYYNNSMHNHVRQPGQGRRIRKAGRAHVGDDQRLGHRVARHGVATSGPTDSAAIRSSATTRSVFNKPGRQYDTVIMMDCSQCPIHPQLKSVFHEYAKKHSDTVRRHGARPVLFMSWAYKDKPEMTSRLAEQYTIAGNANDALVIPAGLAFAKAIAKRPGSSSTPRQATPEPGRHLSRGLHDICGAVPQVTGRVELHSRAGPEAS